LWQQHAPVGDAYKSNNPGKSAVAKSAAHIHHNSFIMGRRYHGCVEEHGTMTHPAVLVVATVCALASIVRPLAAQSPPDAAARAEAMRFLGSIAVGSSRTPTDVTLDQYLRMLRSVFRRADADGDGVVSAADSTLHVRVQSAADRAMSASEIMVADLNGDGVVTETELRDKMGYDARMSSNALSNPDRPRDAEAEQRIDKRVADIMLADTDKDGRITWSEAIAYFGATPDHRAMSMPEGETISARLLVLAPPGKDFLTLADIIRVGEALFHDIDADHDGIISPGELDAWRKKQARQ
jgi:Ca2+-binding EF-hand superfamily protein